MSAHMLAALATLPGAVYEDPDYFSAELSQIFGSRDCFALHTARLAEPGERCCLLVGGRELILVRTDPEEVRAFPNRCLHKGDPILRRGESGRSGVIRCPHHGWTYGLDGRLIGGPGFSTPRERAPCLPELTCSVVGSLVIVRPEGTKRGGKLAWTSAGPLRRDEVSVSVKTIRVAANWKLVSVAMWNREWIYALPNLFVRHHEAGRVLVRIEPLSPDATCMEVAWASSISTIRDDRLIDCDLSIPTAEAEARQRAIGGTDDRTLQEALAITATEVDRAMESAAPYLLRW